MILRNKRYGQFQAAAFGLAAAYLGYEAWPSLSGVLRGMADQNSYAALATLGATFAILIWCAVRSLLQCVRVDPDGLLVRNVLVSRRIPWSRISGFSTASTLAKKVGGGEQTWWGVQVLLRESDRIVKIQASFSRTAEAAEDFAEHLRSVAPPDSATDRLRSPAPVPPAPRDPTFRRRRCVIRSWAFGTGGAIRTLAGCASLAIVGIVIGVILIFADNDVAVVGVVFIAVTVALTGIVVLLARPRLVVSARGLRLRHGRPWPITIPWADVRGVYLVETVNTLLTKRCSYLEVTTGQGAVPLWATLRPTSKIYPVYQRLSAFAPQPPARQPHPIGGR